MHEPFEPLRRAGAGAGHVAHVLRHWLAGGRVAALPERPGFALPRAARSALAALDGRLERIAEVAAQYPAADGGARMLLRLADGRNVESVLLPHGGLCVSTQVGCAVGCTFCMSGRGGLERQLDAAEILVQVVLARRRRPVRRVVFMGMGEPAHNLDAVLEAIDHLGCEGAIGHKELVFSTVGDRRVFTRLAARVVRPALALSLHSTDGALRRHLLPRAPRIEPREVVERALDYARASGHPLQVQWTLLAGINDGDDELRRLIDWLRGERVVVNFIPWNAVPGAPYRSSAPARAHAMSRALHGAGIAAKLRVSHAGEVEGACGQLRQRFDAADAPVAPTAPR